MESYPCLHRVQVIVLIFEINLETKFWGMFMTQPLPEYSWLLWLCRGNSGLALTQPINSIRIEPAYLCGEFISPSIEKAQAIESLLAFSFLLIFFLPGIHH